MLWVLEYWSQAGQRWVPLRVDTKDTLAKQGWYNGDYEMRIVPGPESIPIGPVIVSHSENPCGEILGPEVGGEG